MAFNARTVREKRRFDREHVQNTIMGAGAK